VTVPVVRFTVRGQGAAIAFDRPYTVVYDGYCTVCGRIVEVLRRWDREGVLNIVPSQLGEVRARFPWIPARAYQESVQLVGPHGRTWQGAAALERILLVLPHGGWLAWIFKIPGVRRLAERFYVWFARNRYRLGCGEHCQLRPADLDYAERGSSPGSTTRP
jgi:predicted DCC family thiol-disulfide oxidoreductase YuxK